LGPKAAARSGDWRECEEEEGNWEKEFKWGGKRQQQRSAAMRGAHHEEQMMAASPLGPQLQNVSLS
jgi:hypothetical protein